MLDDDVLLVLFDSGGGGEVFGGELGVVAFAAFDDDVVVVDDEVVVDDGVGVGFGVVAMRRCHAAITRRRARNIKVDLLTVSKFQLVFVISF